MEKDEDGKDTTVEVSRNTPAEPVLDLSTWTKYPQVDGEPPEVVEQEENAEMNKENGGSPAKQSAPA